jgi:hypothetical protein
VYAGTTYGLVKSTDRGATWRKVLPHNTRSLAFDPRHPGRILAATADAGILRSEDGGATFQAVNNGFANAHFPFLATVEGALYTAAFNESGGGGLYRLAVAGGKWESLHNGFRVFGLAGDGSRLYAAGSRGLVTSTDGGKTWKPGANSPGGQPTSVAVCAGRVLTGGEGAKWRRVFPLANGGIAALSGKTIQTSVDSTHWTVWMALPENAEVFAIDSSGSALLAATSLGVWRAEGPRQPWHAVAGAPGGNSVRGLRAHGETVAAATYEAIYLSRDGGKTWGTPQTLAAGPVVGLVFRGERLYALTQRQGVFELRP